MRNAHLVAILGLAVVMANPACSDGGGKDKILEGLGPAAKKPSDVKSSSKNKMTPEELKEARRKAGFKDFDEIAAENAKEFEKGAREYVKTRIKEYQQFLADLRANLDDVEKQAEAWSKAKDPQKAFDKWKKKFGEDSKELIKRYDKLTGNGAEGGNTQAILGRGFRTWEDLKADLSPDIASNERFAAALDEIRKNLDEVDKAIEEIDKDESLVINKFYEDKKKKEDEEEAEAAAKQGEQGGEEDSDEGE